MKPITQDLFYGYKFLSNLEYSPAKDYAVFCVSTIDAENNGYNQHLYTYKNGQVKQLTAAAKESSYFFNDETHVVFINSKKCDAHNTELSVIDVNGGEAQFFARLPLAIGKIEVIDDKYLLAHATIDVACHDFHTYTDEQKQERIAFEKENEDYQVIDEYPYCFNGVGFTNGQRSQLFLIDRNTFEITPVCSRFTDVESSAVSACGKVILYSGQIYENFKGKWSQVYMYNIETGETTAVYEGTTMQIMRVFWHEGQPIVIGTFAEEFGAMENGKFYKLVDGEMKLWIDFDGGMYNSSGSDCRYGHGTSSRVENGTYYFISADNSAICLYKIENDSIVKVIGNEGSVDDFALGKDGSVLLVGMYDSRLQELYEFKDGEMTRLTTLNDEVLDGYFVSKPKRYVMPKKPFDIDGWVLEPIDYDPAKKYPAILDIHGGPKCLYGEMFYHEMQLWASRGYFVFFCNPRGGDGKGNAFADLRYHHGTYGTKDYEDLMDYTDYILSLYPAIDEKRVAVTGGSYGGYMTNWIVGHTDRFACAASQRSISNWVAEVTASDYGIDFAVEMQYDDINNCMEELWDCSPLKYANNVKTPILFIHSFEDYRCPIDQAYAYYTAIRCRGIDTRMVAFKGENHELSRSGKPKHRSKRLAEITAWIEKYTKEA